MGASSLLSGYVQERFGDLGVPLIFLVTWTIWDHWGVQDFARANMASATVYDSKTLNQIHRPLVWNFWGYLILFMFGNSRIHLDPVGKEHPSTYQLSISVHYH